ncbi:MAG: hypothetical protein WAN65_18575, partial [Candidatus Sulfotelmatobacter sp.]
GIGSSYTAMNANGSTALFRTIGTGAGSQMEPAELSSFLLCTGSASGSVTQSVTPGGWHYWACVFNTTGTAQQDGNSSTGSMTNSSTAGGPVVKHNAGTSEFFAEWGYADNVGWTTVLNTVRANVQAYYGTP